MTRKAITLLIFLFAFAEASELLAQSGFEQRRSEIRQQQEQTRSEIDVLEEQIQNYQNRLELASRRYQDMYSQFEELSRLITLQDEQLRRMEEEQQQISTEKRLIEENLDSLELELDELINRYQSILRYLYKHGRETEVALILTSSSINQLLVRAHYLNRFDAYREQQEQAIRSKQQDYEHARNELEDASGRNEESLAGIEQQKRELAQKEEQQRRNIDLLQRDLDSIEQELAQKEEERKQLEELFTTLNEEYEDLIRREEERQRLLAEAEQIEDEEERQAAIARYSTPVYSSSVVSNEEMEAFELAFEGAKGQLPWPVDSGTVIERFGERVHPVFNTRTPNLGIDIASPSRSQVQVVNDGYVLRVQPITGIGDMVMVRHGRFITAYGNLSEVYVRSGHVLRRGDVIGLSGDENSIRGEVLFFVIRDGSETVNPESWIQRPTP